MAVTSEEAVRLVLLIMALGVTGYATVWLASQIRGEITKIMVD